MLRHHHLKTKQLPPHGDPVSALRGRVPLLVNDDVTISRCVPAKPQAELYRNATADEVFFIHRGSGVPRTMLGPLPFKPYDYVVIPRCTTYRLDFAPDTQPSLLLMEAAGSVVIPPKYLNPDGQIRLGAPYYERDLHGPTEIEVVDREEDTPVL